MQGIREMKPKHPFPAISFVTSKIDFQTVKVGDIGQVKGHSHDRVLVFFGDININVLPTQIASAPKVFSGGVGSTVYSLIDHDRIKKGSVGTIVGLSTDKTSKDRVAIAFGISPIAYNFHETMVSGVRPLRPSLTARQNSNAGPFDIKNDSILQDLSESIGGLSIVVDEPCESSHGKQPLGHISSLTTLVDEPQPVNNYASLATLVDEPFESSHGKQPVRNYASLATLVDEPCDSSSGKQPLRNYASFTTLHSKHSTKSSLDQGRVSIEDIRASFEQRQLNNHSERQEFGQMASSTSCLRTEDVTLISHAHGRQRRAERNIQRVELQAAIKNGTKESANPGRDGSSRWRYTYNGVVYITDESSRHEVTSWRIDGEDEENIAPAQVELGGSGCHAVLIIDNSGSMRASDVPGYETRAKALYECLKRDFAQEQLKEGLTDDVVVTLISMSDTSSVLINTKPLNKSLIEDFERMSRRRPRSHGNYIPALDKALEVMTADAHNRSSLLLLFFSDGAPSDQQDIQCEHNVPIFQIDRRTDPLMQHRTKGSAWRCRKLVMEKVQKECLDRVKKIGQVFGRDKVVLRTLAFGPPNENFSLLEQMAGVLPRGEFQKLGLNAANLKTAFSSLSSSMTELRTEGGGRLLTPRMDKVVEQNQKLEETTLITGKEGWFVYAFEDFIGKFKFDGGKLEKIDLPLAANGIAFYKNPFAEGAERFVYRCTEIFIPSAWRKIHYSIAASVRNTAARHGLRLVAKEARDLENHHRGRKFHETFARIQLDAAKLAEGFTKSLPHVRSDWNVSFIPTTIYGCYDGNYVNDQAWILVEPELDGKFTKWNNNAGAVRVNAFVKTEPAITPGYRVGSMAVLEESDEDESEDDDEAAPIHIDDIPQAFSHFSYEFSSGRQLVCDLQGVWNSDDGFVLTDPVVHYVCTTGKRHTNGATDKGLQGVKKFFETHVCCALCKKMDLPSRTPSSLIFVPQST
jgi:hypothetical protein